MKQRDTKKLEELLEHLKKARALVREHIAGGANLQHMHDELLRSEQDISNRLREVREWNRDQKPPEPQHDANGLITNGPTLEEFVAAGYSPENYPPQGYAARPSPALEKFTAEKAAAEKAAVEKAAATAAAENPLPPGATVRPNSASAPAPENVVKLPGASDAGGNTEQAVAAADKLSLEAAQAELLAQSKRELLQIAADREVELAPNASKTEIVDAILKSAGYQTDQPASDASQPTT